MDNELLDALDKAKELIEKGYPVLSTNPYVLAKIIVENQKHINKNNKEE